MKNNANFGMPALGVASHMIAASNKIQTELSTGKAKDWPTVFSKAIRPGATLDYSWWLFAQWLLCKIGEVFVAGSPEDKLCDEVCSMYELGCNNAAIWQGVLVRIALCANPARSQAQDHAIATLAQMAQTALHLISEPANEIAESNLMTRTLDIACQAILSSPNTNMDKHGVYELIGSQFLHTVSLA